MGGACRSYRVRVIRRRVLPASAAVWLAAATLALTGCGDPAPTPTPTPTGFASEAEAFAAAEETYRAYVDALNQVDLSDPTTFEEVYRWTTGDAYAEARESLTQMNADGWTVSGRSNVDLVAPTTDATGSLAIAVCLNVSEVRVFDRNGVSMVAETRGAVQPMIVKVESIPAGEPATVISSIAGRDGPPAC